MRHSGWRRRRTAVRARLLVALTALTFTVTVLIAGILGQTQRDSVDGVRGYLAGLDGIEGAAQVATSLAADAERQNQAFADAKFELFGDLPVESFRRLVSAAYTWEEAGAPGDADSGNTETGDAGSPGDEAITIRLGSYDDVSEHVTVVEGTWPTAPADDEPTPVAIPADSADSWNLEVGEQFRVTALSGASRELLVVALFDRDGSNFWTAEQTLLTGRAVADRSPVLMVAPEVLTESTSVPTVGWTLVADTSRIVPDDVVPLSTALAELPNSVRGDRQLDINGVLTGGGWGTSLGVVQASLDAAVVAQPLPIMLVVAFGLVMLLQLGRLLTEDRRPETVLLKSRGLSAGRLAGWAAVEGAVFAVPGAVFGLLAAALVTGLTTAGWWVAGATVVAALVAMAAPAWRMGAARLLRDRMDDSGRGHTVMAWSALVLLLGAAAFAVWRFRGSGAAAVTDVEGRRVLDPAVLLAPPITLIALVAVGLVLFGVVASTAQRAAAGMTQGLPAVLPARQVARRRTVFGSVVMMLGLAMGGSAVAAGYASTATQLQQQNAVASSGSDVRVVAPERSLSAVSTFRDPLAGFRNLPAATAIAPVLRLDTDAADSTMSLVGIDLDRLADVAGSSAAGDVGAMVTDLRAETPGDAGGTGDDARPPLPEGTTALLLTATFDGVNEPTGIEVSATAWLQTPGGAMVPAVFDTIAPTGQGTAELAATVPGMPAGTRLLAVDLRPDGDSRGSAVTAGIQSLTAAAGGEPVAIDVQAWGYHSLPGEQPELEQDGTGPSAITTDSSRELPELLRFMQVGEPDAAIPAIIDSETQQALDLQVGQRIGVSYGPARLSLEMVGSAAAIPGFPEGAVALTDLTGLNLLLLRTVGTLPAASEIWLASSDSGATKAAAITAAGPAATVTEVGAGTVEALLRPAVRSLWWGIAGALLLGAVGVLLVIATLSRSRRAEIAVLRALGVPSRMQATMRRRELAVTAAVAWVLGLAAGVVSAVLIVPGLARQSVVSVGSGTDPQLSFAWSTWLLLAGTHVVLVAVTIGWHSIALRRHAVVADPREVTA